MYTGTHLADRSELETSTDVISQLFSLNINFHVQHFFWISGNSARHVSDITVGDTVLL